METNTMYGLVLLAGIFAAASGTVLEWAQTRRITFPQLLTVLGPLGMITFAVLGRHEWPGLSWAIVLLGLVGGVTQYLAAFLLKKGLAAGPFSPLWCTCSLSEFVPVVLFSMLYFQEKVTVFQIFSLLATAAAIICGCLTQRSSSETNAGKNRTLLYTTCLILILFMQGILSIILKYTTVNQFQMQQNLLMVFVYLGIFAGAITEIVCLKQKWTPALLGFGALFSIASLGQYVLILFLVTLPAVLVFAMSCTASILFAALGSTLFFHEKRSPAWYGMLIFTVLAILSNR